MNEKEYLESIIVPLLTNPADLKIEHVNDEKGILLTISTNKTDMGRIIGKNGITANSIRTLMRQFGVQYQKHVSVKISDPKSNGPKTYSY